MRLIAGKSKSNIDMIISSQTGSPPEGSTTKKIIAKAKCLTSQSAYLILRGDKNKNI